MNRNKQATMPAYLDGCFSLYDIIDVPDEGNPDFPVKKIKARNIGDIWFREESVFDRTRMTFAQQDIEITKKIRIPQWDGINSMCVCLINGRQHKVYNRTNVLSRQGYPETELTLINPESNYEVMCSC